MSHVDWMANAACAGMPLEDFYPERGAPGQLQSQRARQVCVTCPVQGQCLEFAIASVDDFGIWGGTSEKDRRRMRQTDVQLELMRPAARRPRERRQRRTGRLRSGSLRGSSVEGQLAMVWWDDLDDERYGVFGLSPARTTIRSMEAS